MPSSSPTAARPRRHHLSKVVLLAHLVVWTYLGVLSRSTLEKLFLMGCGLGDGGPCLEGSIYFKDLVPNILGSFFIGLAVAASTLSLATDKPIAILGQDHPWQENFALQIGFRTGFCGSMTTFSTWMLSLWGNAMTDNLWIEAVLGTIVGLATALLSYIFGTHVVLYVDRYIIPQHEDVLELRERYHRAELLSFRHQRQSQASRDALGGVREHELEDLEGDIPRFAWVQSEESASQEDLSQRRDGRMHSSDAMIRNGDSESRKTRSLFSEPSKKFDDAILQGPRQQQLEEFEGDVPRLPMVDGAGLDAESPPPPHALPALSRRESNKTPATLKGKEDAHEDESVREKSFLLALSKTDLIAILCTVLFAAAAACGVAFETRHRWLRETWMAVLFGPLGSYLRYRLSFYNYKGGPRWDWLPTGTLIANMMGVAVVFGLEAVVLKASLGYWGLLIVSALQAGFCGALTTVSTLVMELVKTSEVFPDSFTVYVYGALTFVGGVIIALAVFGWAAWSS